MPKRKTRAEGRDKPRPTPDIQQQVEEPEKQDGPRPAAAMPDLETPEQAPGAAGRARKMADMQQSVGNTRISQMANKTVQKQPANGPSDSAEEEESAGRSAISERAARTHESKVIQRQPAGGAAAPAPATVVPQDILDQVISASLVQTLRSFQNIPIEVSGFVPLPAGQAGPPSPVTKTVHVSSGYFINTARARAHYGGRRRRARFRAIKRELRRQGAVSEIQSTRGGELSAGRAVEVGKGTPEDIKLVIEEALRQGVIRRYAIRNGAINRNQQLVDLDDAALQALIQRWVYHVGIGVDCSGFVLQAAIRAREAERALISAFNLAVGMVGGPQLPLPPERSRRIRSAASFRGGPRVRRPTDLRPGDAWVVRGGGHIRIVTAVREVTRTGGVNTIEFDTAESAGGSIQPRPGPVGRMWQTHSRATFHPIRAVGHAARSRGGTFHRIP